MAASPGPSPTAAAGASRDILSPEFASIRAPLSELVDVAQRSTNSRRADVLGAAALACASVWKVPGQPEFTADDLVKGVTLLFGLIDGGARARVAQAEAAKAKLTGWCDGRDWSELSKMSGRMRRVTGGVSMGINVTSPMPVTSPRHAQQRQAVEQVLLNPQIHVELFDRWLARAMVKQVPAVAALSWDQQHLVSDLLYHGLTGVAPDPLSLRELQDCAVEMWCPASLGQLSLAQREQAQQVADQIAALIRSQRLDELLHWPGG